jgi:hypothetical protein
MSVAQVNTEAIDRLLADVRSLETIDFAPLMEDWRALFEADNEAGALEGLDGYGVPLEAVTYRPDPSVGRRKPIDYTIQPNDNLTGSHYRSLDGPPLAPQGLESRIVTHYRTEWRQPTPSTWFTQGAWQDVKTVNGLSLLPFHFDGPEHNPRLPIRHLAAIRPRLMEKCRATLRDFVQRILKGQR